jgi:hypothetical protein
LAFVVAERDGDQKNVTAPFLVDPNGLFNLLTATSGNGSRTDGASRPTPAPHQAMVMASPLLLVEPPGHLHVRLDPDAAAFPLVL